MERKVASEQKNVGVLFGKEAYYNKIYFIAVAGDPIRDNGVKSTDDSQWKEITAPLIEKYRKEGVTQTPGNRIMTNK